MTSAPLRVLAVDDEPLALRRLEIVISGIDDARLIATARSGPEAMDAISRLSPDVLLLDVEMNGMSGFGLVESLVSKGFDGAPQVVFVTAHDRFASRAFDVSAADYVLKPVDFDRLRSALARARDRKDAAESRDREAELRMLLATLRASPPALGRLRYEREIWVQRRGEFVNLLVDDIEWIAAERDYIRLNSAGGSFLLRETMNGIALRLDTDQFLRIHRSTIVQRRFIDSLIPGGLARFRIRLHSGTELNVGRSYIAGLKQMLVGLRT